MDNQLVFEGLSLTVASIERSVHFYVDKIGVQLEYINAPAFALLRADNCTIGLLSIETARNDGVELMTIEQKKAIHVEFSTNNLDALYEELKARGVLFQVPPHDEPWERSMTALDPDGYSVEFAQGRRGRNMLQSGGIGDEAESVMSL